MAAFSPLIAVLAVLFAGVHPTANEPDPTWIGGLYDDADSDSLISTLGTASHVLAADLTLKVPRVAQIFLYVGVMNLAGLGTPSARPFFRLDIRGPPDPGEITHHSPYACLKQSPGSSRPIEPACCAGTLTNKKETYHENVLA